MSTAAKSVYAWDRLTTSQRLHEARVRSRKTLAQAQHVLDLSRPTMIGIEKGRRDATAGEIIKLAELYGCKVSDIMGGTVERLSGTHPLLGCSELFAWCDRWSNGQVTEGQFARFPGIDRVSARVLKMQCEMVAQLLLAVVERKAGTR